MSWDMTQVNGQRYSPLLCVQSLASFSGEPYSEVLLSSGDLTHSKAIKQPIACDEVSLNAADSKHYEQSLNITLEDTGSKIHINVDKIGGTLQIGNNNQLYVHRTKSASTQARTDGSDQRRKVVQMKVPKRVITDDDMDNVAVHLGTEWRRLGMKLGFVRGELDAFEYDHRTAGLHEIIYQMLLAWKEKQGSEAYVRIVASCLVDIKRPDVAKLFSVNKHTI